MAVPRRTAETTTRTQDREEVAEMYFCHALNEKNTTWQAVFFLWGQVDLTKLTLLWEVADISQCAPVHPSGQKHLYCKGTFDIVSTDASVSTGLFLQLGQFTSWHGRLAFYAREAPSTVAGEARCCRPMTHPVSTTLVQTRLNNK